MGYKEERKLIRVGGNTPAVTLPRPWVDYHGLQYGDRLILLGNAVMLIVPKGKEDKARRLLEALEK